MRAAVVVAVTVLAGCGGGYKTYRVPSSAMEPTVRCARPAPGCTAAQDDRIRVKLYRGRPNPRRRDIVLFAAPPAAAMRCGVGGKFVKRVIGLPGESVRVDARGVVSVDGRALREPYVARGRRLTGRPASWRVPRGSYVVLGDNRASSCDSMVWGPLPGKNLIGRVVEILRGSKRLEVR